MEHQGENYTEALATFASKSTYEDIPAEVIHQTKRLILDTIGCALGGYTTDKGRIARALVKRLGGKPESTVIGSGDKTSCSNAAFANANMTNALDNDDTFMNMAHFANHAVQAALAVGETTNAGGKEVINAVVLGYDIAGRVVSSTGGFWIRTEEGKIRIQRGFGFGWQVLAAAIAAGKIFNFDEEQMYHTIGIAGSMGPVGSLAKWFEPPLPLVKYGDAGWTVQAGVVGAMLAQEGYTGYHAILDGDLGFWRMYGADECDFSVLTGQMGKKWYIMDSSFKPWPSCRFTHQPLTIFIALMKEHSIKPEEIEKVIIKGSGMTTEPVFLSPEPSPGPIGPQFSGSHVMAMAAYGIPPGPEWQRPELVDDPKIRRFRERVTIERDKELFKDMARQVPGLLKRVPTTIEVSAGGKLFSKSGEYAKGDPWLAETRMTDDELRDKFRCNAAGVLTTSLTWRRQIEEVMEMVYRLEEVKCVSELVKLLVA